MHGFSSRFLDLKTSVGNGRRDISIISLFLIRDPRLLHFVAAMQQYNCGPLYRESLGTI